jgi:ribosomal protein S12 methylthiotransferase
MKYHIITLGCPKNNVDSEGMAGILASRGHTVAASAESADVLIVNTCSFIASARDETLAVLREMGDAKAPGQRLIAAGCMAQSHGDLVAAVPGVDAILSTQQWMRVAEVAENAELSIEGAKKASLSIDLTPHAQPAMATMPVIALQAAAPTLSAAPPAADFSILNSQFSTSEGYADWRTAPILRHASGPSAYLKISDGCNLRCAFCTIPSFKGDMRCARGPGREGDRARRPAPHRLRARPEAEGRARHPAR